MAVKALKIRACLYFLNFTIINKALVSGLGRGGGQTAVHNGQLRTNSCENGRLVTSQVNHLISDNLLFQFLCCEHQPAGPGMTEGEDCVCLQFARLSDHQSYNHTVWGSPSSDLSTLGVWTDFSATLQPSEGLIMSRNLERITAVFFF